MSIPIVQKNLPDPKLHLTQLSSRASIKQKKISSIYFPKNKKKWNYLFIQILKKLKYTQSLSVQCLKVNHFNF